MAPAAAMLLALCAPSRVLAGEVTLFPVQDTTVFEDYPTSSNGAGPVLFVGTIASGGRTRALVKFDLATLPADATIRSVALRFTVNRIPPRYQLQVISLYRLTASWGEGTSSTAGGQGAAPSAQDATWRRRFSGGGGVAPVDWASQGGDFVSAPSATSPAVFGTVTYTIASTPQLIADVEGWRISPASNHGWMLIGVEGGESSVNRIDSREAGPSTSPALVITYDEAQGDGGSGEGPLPIWVLGLVGGGLLWQMRRSRQAA